MNPKWLVGFPALSATLMEFGWFVAPNINGGEFDRIEELCQKLSTVDMQDKTAVTAAETEIFHILSEAVYHPNYRAKFVRLGLKVEHFKDFSHLYESAIFAYYKRDYAGSILLFLATLEGVLIKLSGWQLGSGRQPGHNQLIRNVRALTPARPLPAPIASAHDMYRDVFAQFLERWIYRHTNDADFGISVLNRHYVMHGFEPGNFYRPHDVHRMILAFDVMIEWMALNQHIFDDAFIDNKDPMIAKRMEYYHSMSEGDQTVKQTWKRERGLLSDHPKYASPDHEIDVEQSRMRSALEMLSLMQRFGKITGQSDP